MMKKAIGSITVAALAVAAGAALAQEAGEENMMTYTGCVKAGEDGAYMLTNVMVESATDEPAQGEESAPEMLSLSSSSVEIESHEGEKVTLMGHAMKEGSAMKLDVTSLKMVSVDCP